MKESNDSLNNSSAINQSPCSSSNDTYNNNLTHIFVLFSRNQDPHPGGRWWLHAVHKHIDPRLVGTSRLMIKITKTSPCYLNTKKSEESPWAATLKPHVAFKNPSLDVDGSRDCHTEWSKSEREKQISYINACMWNLEKWYRWTVLQGRSWDTDVENKHMDTKGGKLQWRGEDGVLNWVTGIDMYSVMCIKLMTD